MNEPAKSGRHQRSFKNILINPAYQFKYIFWISMTGVILVALNASVFYYYIRENYALLVDLSPMTDEAKAQLYSELNSIILKLSAASFVFLSVVSYFGIVMSHRTAGPMFHFKRVFGQIKDGKTDARIRLRPKDDFQDVATSFNEMMDTLSKRG
jgi:methyl-accepting chemotaxis protein